MRCARTAAIYPRATRACTSASERPHKWRALSSTGHRDGSRSFRPFPLIAKPRSGKEQARPSPRRLENSVRLRKMTFLGYAGAMRIRPESSLGRTQKRETPRPRTRKKLRNPPERATYEKVEFCPFREALTADLGLYWALPRRAPTEGSSSLAPTIFSLTIKTC